MSRYLPPLCGPAWLIFAATLALAAEPLPVAVLNLDHIFSPGTYAPLSEQMAPLKLQAAELQRTIQLRQVELETIQNQLRTAAPGSPQFEKLKQQFAKVQLEGQQYADREQKALQTKEAEIYLAVYREIEEEVKKYCQAKGIKLVLRRSKVETAGNPTPQEVLKAINQNVLYEDGLDITDDILKALNERHANQ